ncbi:MAG: D-alanyl-D-alanine carboxypeptidase [Litoricola sp.]|jgi:D-alanyl-D-alanine carboxypeptidase (penicillin-binding protein 5/6)|nr:D-alanyl-D-alanine carboxypeptidase [Litorivicinus sp.]MBT6287129.1 D-alanyl-D-alanine carboxypeptidase [Oceanospirillales bacterium]HAB68083.1 serine-type D-Ala-D-Ala carboxypeptidase [Gammaproteobacteria bacterium]MBL6809534.1 D-alanyl-D-alanine carboxypeptidase [Litorivicinus sp.]MBL6825259.1 D-alanyl-D-alanine carboxypeptidase [Litorivicinus sp.]
MTSAANVPLTEALGNGPPIPAAPKLQASGYLLVDAINGEILVEHNAEEPLPPASLTKMMTAYIAEREITEGRMSFDDQVPVSVKAWKTGGSRMFIREGTEVRLEDLLRGIIIQSGNDASVAVAEYIAGSEDVFADVMNQTAISLGMTNTQFKNATGLPQEGHYTTAKDLSILAARIIQDFPDTYPIYEEKNFTYNGIKQANRNSLLFRDPTVDGLKTGHTEEAGYCLVASAERDGFRLISVVMGTASEKAREQETTKLLQYGFRYFSGKTVFAAGEPLPESARKVWFGEMESVDLAPTEPLYVTLPLGRESAIQATLDAPDTLDAPLEAGAVVGTVKIMLGERVLAESPVAVAEAVPEGGLFKRLMDFVLRLFA